MPDTKEARSNGLTYREAGVDIDAADALIKRIAPMAAATRRPGADAELGGFGALFDLKAAGYGDPILVASTDGVGTKLKLAIEARDLSTIGQDLVAMCVNDVVVQGAEPLFFLDYYATGKLSVEDTATIVEGIARACQECSCALIGGETAEMPGLYAAGDFDLAGFAVGAVERRGILPRKEQMHAGDVLIGVASSGIHSNGFSLVRKLRADLALPLEAAAPFATDGSLAQALLTPTRLYVKGALAAIRSDSAKGFAHITGGGITENLPRILPADIEAHIDLNAWASPPVFRWLATAGGISAGEMLRTFNCGIGFVAIASEGSADACIEAFNRAGDFATVIGILASHQSGERVRYTGSASFT